MSAARQGDRIVWRIFPAVRPGERERFVFFALLSGLLSLGQTVGLAGSDALFLAEFGAQALPMAFIGASVFAVTGSLGYALKVGRTRNDTLYVWMLAGVAVSLASAVFVLALGERSMLVVFFCFVYVTQAVFINLHYPTFAADYFDSLSSKRVFPYLVACGSGGGILGGLLALGLTRVGPTEGLIVAWAVVLAGSAAFVAYARRDLKRWIPVGDEADEASAEGILSATRFLRRSPVARWLTLSVIGMVLALFLMQYLEMEIFARSFESPEALAAFIAVYLAVSNGIEILVLSVLTPFLLRRFGIAQANLVHPLLTLLTFGALAVHPQLAVAVLARGNRELMDSALAAPVRSLAYNALPLRFRGRVRALLEGIIFYAAMSIAGLALVLVGDARDAAWLSAVGALSALLYAGANLRVRREYIRSIVDELRSGRLDLQDVGGNLGDREVARLADQWERSLAEETRLSTSWLELPALLARHGLCDPIRRNARHADPAVRIACIEALASMQDAALEELLREALADASATVRSAAVLATDRLGGSTGPLGPELHARLEDSDPGVRAEAAMRLGATGLATLRTMMSEPLQSDVIEALPRLPHSLLPEAQQKLGAEDAGIRAAALDCVTRLGGATSLSLGDLEGDLDHPEVRVRLAAIRALGSRTDESSCTALGRALDDTRREVRAEAAAMLGSLGERGVRAATASVASIRRWTADAALQAVAGAATDSSRSVLQRAFRERVSEAWRMHVATELVPESSDLSLRFLRVALEDAYDRCCWIAFQALGRMEDPLVVRSLRKVFDHESASDRVDALEVLTNLGEREPARQLALLLEQEPVAVKLSSLPASLDLPKRFEQVVERAEGSGDRWIQLAARGLARDPEDPPTPEVHLMEGLLALRGVPFFTHLSLEQLEALGRFMEETAYLAGEVVVREDEEGEELFVILEGEAKAIKNYGSDEQIELTTHSPTGICYFGEIAILDRARRSATVVVTQDARLLTLDGERFTELILQAPEISFEVFRVLIKRLRVAEGRVRELIEDGRPQSAATSGS